LLDFGRLAIAFFDLDLTLLSVNSAVRWVQAERKAGHITRWQALRAALWLVRYRLGFSSLQDALREAILTLKGRPEREVRARTDAFYDKVVRPAFRPGGLAALEERRRLGDRCVLLTSSSNYIAERVARDLGLDGVICNRFEVDTAGLYTGRSAGLLCFADGKREAAEAFCREAGVPLSQCAFYTDSFTDLPVLLAVREPVVVNPDRRLKKWAARRGWRVVDWGAPVPASSAPQASVGVG